MDKWKILTSLTWIKDSGEPQGPVQLLKCNWAWEKQAHCHTCCPQLLTIKWASEESFLHRFSP